MCKHIRNNGLKCKIKSKSDYCHIHKKYQIDEFKQNEIKNLNKVIEKKHLKYKKLLEIKQDMINELLIESEIKERYIQEYGRVNLELKNKIQQLEIDAKNYQIIRQFEKEKQELINKGIDIYNYKNDEWHQKRYYRNLIAHPVN